MLKKYPFIKQDDLKDCGVSALLMIIKFYKGNVSKEYLRDITKTNKNGTTAYHIIEASKKLGFNASGIKIELKNINNNIILPCIANVTIDNKYKHYIVIYNINYSKKELTIADPAKGIIKMSFNDFSNIFNNILIILYPIKNIPFNNYNNSIFKFVINNLKISKTDFIIIIVLSFVITLFSILSSFYFKIMLDNTDKTTLIIGLIFAFFFITDIFKNITNYLRNQILININNKIDFNLTTNIFKRIILLPYHYYRNRTTGEIISRINDLSTIREVISKVAVNLFIDTFLTVLAAIFLYLISPKMFIIAVIFLLIYLIIILIFRKVINRKIEDVKNEKAEANSYMVEAISGFESIKGLGIEKSIIKNFNNKYFNQIDKTKMFEQCYNKETFFKDLTDNVCLNIIILFGMLLLIKEQITLGELLAFNTLLSYFFTPIKNIINLDMIIKESKISINRIFEIINYKSNDGLLESNFNNIKIKNLYYTLNDNDYILKDINLEINKGDKVMLCGKSGSGKSTILKLLKKYDKVSNNCIFMDNIDINNYTKKAIDNNITYISQNEILFTDTLYNNILLKRNISPKKVIKLANICYVNEITNKNDLGYKMLIEENGFNISGGEKERIILSRSLLNNFNILLIDEGLSQMDIDLERKILKNLFKYYKDKTIIIVSHRFDNSDLFDKIIRIENGKIINELRRNE